MKVDYLRLCWGLGLTIQVSGSHAMRDYQGVPNPVFRGGPLLWEKGSSRKSEGKVVVGILLLYPP